MNTPYKGQIDWLPDFIGEELMNQQELQGNKRDISVFENDIRAEMSEGGFDWDKTAQKREFWVKVLLKEDINLFLAWFKPELEVFDNEKKEDRQYSFETFDEIISFLKSKGYKIMRPVNEWVEC